MAIVAKALLLQILVSLKPLNPVVSDSPLPVAAPVRNVSVAISALNNCL